MQEFLGADQSAFRKRLGFAQDFFGNGLHGVCLSGNIYHLLTSRKENEDFGDISIGWRSQTGVRSGPSSPAGCYDLRRSVRSSDLVRLLSSMHREMPQRIPIETRGHF